MVNVLKICGSSWVNASRDKRELSVYQELGAEVTVLAKGNVEDYGRIDYVDGFRVIRYTTRPLGKYVPDMINRFISLFLWAYEVRKINPDIISGHDLMPALTIAWMATLFKKKKPKLIYDSHEFELGRNVKRGIIQKLTIKYWERFLIKRCVFTIMVNDSIADEVQHIHKLKTRPVVIRNTPQYWELNEVECLATRKHLLEMLKEKERKESQGTLVNEETFLIIYYGAITFGRGIETLIRLVSINPEIKAIILGNGDEKYVKSIIELAKKNKVDGKIIFHSAVNVGDLWKYVGAADLSLVMISKGAKSYYYALPNKFFESIQSLTPIVASDFPEMRRIIKHYGIGLVSNPDDINQINACVERMRTDKKLYDSCKEQLKIAKKELCWEKEKQILADEFSKIICNELCH